MKHKKPRKRNVFNKTGIKSCNKSYKEIIHPFPKETKETESVGIKNSESLITAFDFT